MTDIQLMPETQKAQLIRDTLQATHKYFQDPEVQERFRIWQTKRNAVPADGDCRSEDNHHQDYTN